MKRALVFMVLAAGVAGASVISSGGNGGGAAVDVLAELVGKNVSASTYTATTTTGPAFQSTGNVVDAVRLGTGPRASIGTCNSGGICLGPNDGTIGTMVFVSGSVVANSAQIRGPLDMLGVDAYLINNNASDPVRVEDLDGLRINGGTPLKKRLVVPVIFDSAAISNNACNPQAVTVPGALDGDFVDVNAQFALPGGVGIQGVRVTASDTVELNICNNTAGGALDPDSGSFLFRLER